MVAVVPPHRHFDADAATLTDDEDRFGHHGRLVPVEIFHEFAHTAVVEKFGALQLGAAIVLKDDLHAGIQEGEFAQPVFQRLERIFEVRERPLRAFGPCGGEEPHLGPLLARIGIADDAQGFDRLALFELGVMFLAAPPDP